MRAEIHGGRERKRSTQRPDTLMQDRKAPDLQNLLQRTVGPYIWVNFSSVPDTLLAMSVIPMAIIGGIFALFLMQIPFSISAAIGFIALFGISVMDGII